VVVLAWLVIGVIAGDPLLHKSWLGRVVGVALIAVLSRALVPKVSVNADGVVCRQASGRTRVTAWTDVKRFDVMTPKWGGPRAGVELESGERLRLLDTGLGGSQVKLVYELERERERRRPRFERGQ